MNPLISIADATEKISHLITSSQTEYVSLENASGKVLRENIVSDRSIPPFNRVMMDGIAIDSQEFHGLGTAFSIAGTQAAGKPALTKNTPQSCFEVMTGAILPNGCDCIIPVEEISISGDSVILSPDADVTSGKYIHQTGSDAVSGKILIEKGTVLGATDLAIAASVGTISLSVSKLPKITLITSGDEVLPPAQTPAPFQIRSSHPSALVNMIDSNHLGICEHIHLPDSREATAASIKTALSKSDFIVFTGGISKGKFDFVASELINAVGEPIFHGVKQRPGKPFGCWNHSPSNTTIFALPGNPVSVCATAARYLIPALQQHLDIPQNPKTISLSETFTWTAPIAGFAPCRILPNYTASVIQMQNSGDYLCLQGANGFIEFPQGNFTVKNGIELPFYPI